MALAEGLQEGYEAARPDGAHHAELELDIVKLGEALGALLRGIGLDQHLGEVRAHHLAQARQMGVVALAAEQRPAQFVLQPLDGARQRGLRDIAGLGRPREVQGLADGQEIPDLMHFHGGSLPEARPDCQSHPAPESHSLRLAIPFAQGMSGVLCASSHSTSCRCRKRCSSSAAITWQSCWSATGATSRTSWTGYA